MKRKDKELNLGASYFDYQSRFLLSQSIWMMSESRLREGAAALEKAFAANGTKQSGQDQVGQVVNFQK